jgi:hypothetical protein
VLNEEYFGAINYSVKPFLTVIVLCVKIYSRKNQTMQIEVGPLYDDEKV